MGTEYNSDRAVAEPGRVMEHFCDSVLYTIHYTVHTDTAWQEHPLVGETWNQKEIRTLREFN